MLRDLPNIITLFRVLSAPIVAFLLWQEPSFALTLFTLILFIIAAASDWLDGWLARQMESVSPFGRMLDPIADKLLVAGTILAIAATRSDGSLFLLPALLILMREFLIAGLREFLAGTNLIVPVSMMAKWKTAIQLVAIGIIIGAPLFDPALPLDQIGLILFWISALMTVKTGYDYFQAARPHLHNPNS